MGGRGSGSSLKFKVPEKQLDWERTALKDNKYEYGAYFSASGELLLQEKGTSEEINFDSSEINHKVEQRVWADEQIEFVHTHTENTIFSPEDLDAFELMENHSERALLPNGTTYTLIRNQPRTSTVFTLNEKTGQLEREFEPKHIADKYRKEYTKIYNKGIKEIKSKYKQYSKEYRQAVDNLFIKTITPHMEKWLKSNARKYGYIFQKGR